MESFQFQRSKKKQANEDNAGGEQKNYCLVLNSNDRVAGNHNTAEFNIPFEFLPHNYEYYRMDYAFQSTAGVYRDGFSEFGISTLSPHNIISLSTAVFDANPTGMAIIPGAKVFSLEPSSLTLPSDLKILNFRNGLGGGGAYQLNQTITAITSTTFTASMATTSNIMVVTAGTPVIGRYVTATASLPNGARILFQDPTTPSNYFLSKSSTGVIASSTFTQFIPAMTRLNNTVVNLSVDFGCKKFLYDTRADGPSAFVGVIPRITNTVAGTNYYRSWWDEQPSQIINMNNFSGTIRTRITNVDGDLLTDDTGIGIELPDMTPWQMFISFTPIPSSAIETQCY
jgi:hypothetical protein